MIFLTTAVLAFLINWAFGHQNIGKVTLGALTTSWLWLPLILFWLWNILDAGGRARCKAIGLLPGLLFAAVILYVIAWEFTDVRLDRLVERFDAAQTVSTNLLNPDMLTMSVGGEDRICAWECVSQVRRRQAGRAHARGRDPGERQPAGHRRAGQAACRRHGLAGAPGPGGTGQHGEHLRGRLDDRDDRHGLDGDDLLDHPGRPGQLPGGAQHHVAGAGRHGDLLRVPRPS